MKQTLKSLIKTVKSVKGNSLAEFATTTALMATLAATAAPKSVSYTHLTLPTIYSV